LFLVLWFFSSGGQETADLGSNDSALAENYIEPEPTADDETSVTQAAMLAPTLAPTLIPITAITEPTPGDAAQSELAQIDINSSVVTKANDQADRATPSVEQEGQQQTQRGLPSLTSPTIAASPESEVSGEPSLTVDGRGLTKPESGGGRILIEAEGNDLLLITFLGASWIEVSDSADNLLYQDLRDSGDVLEIKGAAPFDVLLGDAPFAKMTLNGIDIDVSKNTRIDNSARLTVGL
jgi:cytoskeleton protein RodZ